VSSPKTRIDSDSDNGKSRLSESAYESLVELILTGALQPGESVSELALARRLNVSRTPMHEAIKQLVKDGLIIQSANRRPVIISFSTDDIFDIYEMRLILESEAAAKSAENMDLHTLQELESELKSFQKKSTQPQAIQWWVELDDRFHGEVARAGGSRRLAEDIGRYRQLHRVFNRTHSDPKILKQAIAEHAAILSAIRKRSPQEARDAMQTHLKEWQRYFVKHLGSE